jgi:hypothetical protein
MTRWLAFIAAAFGIGLGVGLPGGASGDVTGKQLSVVIQPPTLTTGSSPLLSCGWHTACTSPPSSGIALDWDDDNMSTGNTWYFRCFCYVSDTNRTAFTMYPLINSSGGGVCDVMTVWVVENHSGALMAIPNYMHVNITDYSSFSWQGGPWTIYNSRPIGTTINDTGCTWFGSHVHEYHTDYRTNVVTITRNTALYPTGSQCSTSCGNFANNNISNWIRKFAWAEGIVSH